MGVLRTNRLQSLALRDPSRRRLDVVVKTAGTVFPDDTAFRGP
jgi:hypothetical protein